jgi:hypothetical protein
VLLLSSLSTTCASQEVFRAGAPEPDKRVTLETQRRDYLLGEPVVLDLRFRNLSNETIKVVEVFVEPTYYEAPLWISRQGEQFQTFRPNTEIAKRERRTLVLKPMGSLTYKYRVVGVPSNEVRLALPKSGAYRVYSLYPLYVAGGSPQSRELPSNVVEIRIQEPSGEDAKVWQQLRRDPALISLLQAEAVDEEHKDTPVRMAEILIAYPASRYAPALRHALLKVVPRLKDSVSFEQASRLADILGIKDFARAEDDPKEKRLDAIRKESFMQHTTVGHVLRSLSKDSGLALDSTPPLKSRTIRMADSLATVRDCMRTLRSAVDGAWERRGEGYFLVPVDADKIADPKQSKVDQK